MKFVLILHRHPSFHLHPEAVKFISAHVTLLAR